MSYSEVHEIQISKDGENWTTVDSYCRFARAFEEVTKMLVDRVMEQDFLLEIVTEAQEHIEKVFCLSWGDIDKEIEKRKHI